MERDADQPTLSLPELQDLSRDETAPPRQPHGLRARPVAIAAGVAAVVLIFGAALYVVLHTATTHSANHPAASPSAPAPPGLTQQPTAALPPLTWANGVTLGPPD